MCLLPPCFRHPCSKQYLSFKCIFQCLFIKIQTFFSIKMYAWLIWITTTARRWRTATMRIVFWFFLEFLRLSTLSIFGHSFGLFGSHKGSHCHSVLWGFTTMFLLKVLVNTHSCRIKKKFTFKSRFVDFLKSKRFKKREWICSHLQQKVEEFKSWAPIFIQKTLKKTKLHITIHFLFSKAREKVIFVPLIWISQLF